MYRRRDPEQLGIEAFFMPFGGRLRKDNRWVKPSAIMPWDYIEEVYMKTMNEDTGRPAFSARIAFGAIYVKESEGLRDENTVTMIQENPYIETAENSV